MVMFVVQATSGRPITLTRLDVTQIIKAPRIATLGYNAKCVWFIQIKFLHSMLPNAVKITLTSKVSVRQAGRALSASLGSCKYLGTSNGQSAAEGAGTWYFLCVPCP